MRHTNKIELLESSFLEFDGLSSSLVVTFYVLVVGTPDLDSLYDLWFTLEASLDKDFFHFSLLFVCKRSAKL